MAFFLIPPFRVNYSITELICSLFVNEHRDYWKKLCREQLYHLFNGYQIYLTSSGRTGLYLILKSLNQQKVYVPAYTCPVVIEAIRLARKDIIYVQTSPETFNTDNFEGIDDNSIVLATHQYGNPCDILSVKRLCEERGAVLIEDCAAALGTKVNGHYVGTYGDFAIFSFNSTKLINAPSMGGFIVVKDKGDFNKIVDNLKYEKNSWSFKIKHLIRSLIFCIAKNKYIYPLIYHLYIKRTINQEERGTKEDDGKVSETYYHPFYEWQAKVVYKQLCRLTDIQLQRKKQYRFYDSSIQNDKIIKPIYNPDAVCCRYTIRVKDRGSFYRKCVGKGVDMDYSFSHIICPSDYKGDKEIALQILNIPFYCGLNDKDMKYIVNVLNSI